MMSERLNRQLEWATCNQYELDVTGETDALSCMLGADGSENDDDDDGFDLSFFKHQLEQQVDPKVIEEMECDLLHFACRRGCSLDIIEYLVEGRKVDVEKRTEYDIVRNTPLHTACSSSGTLSTVKYLVEKGNANTTALNADQWSPLHLACYYDNLDVVQYFIEEKKINPQIGHNSGNSPLHAACASSPSSSEQSSKSVVRYLLPYSIVDEEVLSLIWDACSCWELKEELVENYLKHHHDVPVPLPANYYKQFPLHAVLQCPLPSEAAFLDCLNHYCNDETFCCLKTMDQQGRLPLHVALDSVLMMKKATGTSPLLLALRARCFLKPKVIHKLIQLDPRAATVRDASTGRYPVEVALEIYSKFEADDDSWFHVMHTLQRKPSTIHSLQHEYYCCVEHVQSSKGRLQKRSA